MGDLNASLDGEKTGYVYERWVDGYEFRCFLQKWQNV